MWGSLVTSEQWAIVTVNEAPLSEGRTCLFRSGVQGQGQSYTIHFPALFSINSSPCTQHVHWLLPQAHPHKTVMSWEHF